MPAKTKSYDADDIVGGCGTARARIARAGIRTGAGARSRSPSHSPVRPVKEPRSPSPAATCTASASQAYVAKCDSVESLNCGENAALLNSEDKSRSQTSLLIYFDDKDMQDTVV